MSMRDPMIIDPWDLFLPQLFQKCGIVIPFPKVWKLSIVQFESQKPNNIVFSLKFDNWINYAINVM